MDPQRARRTFRRDRVFRSFVTAIFNDEYAHGIGRQIEPTPENCLLDAETGKFLARFRWEAGVILATIGRQDGAQYRSRYPHRCRPLTPAERARVEVQAYKRLGAVEYPRYLARRARAGRRAEVPRRRCIQIVRRRTPHRVGSARARRCRAGPTNTPATPGDADPDPPTEPATRGRSNHPEPPTGRPLIFWRSPGLARLAPGGAPRRHTPLVGVCVGGVRALAPVGARSADIAYVAVAASGAVVRTPASPRVDRGRGGELL